MDKIYKSIYGPSISRYLKLKKNLGYAFSTGTFYLGKLDELAYERKETCKGITKELAEVWCKKADYETDLNHYTRVGHLANFSSYLVGLKIESYVPRIPKFRKCTFIPYIYSQKEIQSIFEAADKLKQANLIRTSGLINIPALLRLLYSTGMRLGEALELKDSDINFAEGLIHIKHSKNGQERILPISDSLISVLKEYVRHRDRGLTKRDKDGYFFVKLNGGKSRGQLVRKWFHRILEEANIKSTNQQKPRVHDLRHTFAVTCFVKMAEDEMDLYASLPILSTYLGHQRLAATNHYIRLTVNAYPELMQKVNMISSNVFPELKFDEKTN